MTLVCFYIILKHESLFKKRVFPLQGNCMPWCIMVKWKTTIMMVILILMRICIYMAGVWRLRRVLESRSIRTYVPLIEQACIYRPNHCDTD